MPSPAEPQSARRMSSEGRKEMVVVPATALRCRVCETAVPPRPDRGLRPLLRAARPGLRPRRAAPHRQPRVDRGRPAVDLALRAAAARRAARRAAARPPGWTPLVRAPRLAEALGRRRALAEARHGEPDALVQGSRRRGRRGEGDRARAHDARVLVDRQPRERRRGACGGRGARGGRALSRPTSSRRS